MKINLYLRYFVAVINIYMGISLIMTSQYVIGIIWLVLALIWTYVYVFNRRPRK